MKQDNKKSFILYGQPATNGNPFALLKIKEWTWFTRITTIQNSITKICCSYWQEFLKKKKTTTTPSPSSSLIGEWRVPKLDEMSKRKLNGGTGLVEETVGVWKEERGYKFVTFLDSVEERL